MAEVEILAGEWADPCVRYQKLHDSYMRMLSGGQEEMVRYRSNEVERELRFAKSNLSELREELRKAEDECREKQGLPKLRRRFAIEAGSRRY